MPCSPIQRRVAHRLKATAFSAMFVVSMLLPLIAQGPPAASPEPLGVRIIVVGSAGEAQQILGLLRYGWNFAGLAREKSIDSTAPDGGYMGKIDPASLRAELRDALRGLAPGQVSEPIKIPSGYAILKVLAANEPGEEKNKVPNEILPLAGQGSVRYTPNIAGAPEADAALQAYPKEPGFEQDLRAICQARKQSVSRTVDRLGRLVDEGDRGQSSRNPAELLQMRYVLGELEAYLGNMDQMILRWEKAYHSLPAEHPEAGLPLEEALGIAYLHKSEMENGVYKNPGDRCIFPPRPDLAYDTYKKPASSEAAIRYFMKYLDKKPDDLEIKWQLNLAYMTLGKYPEGVPAKDLIPPSAFASRESVGRFTDVAKEAGVDLFSMAGGLIVDDFDNDGLLDIITSSYDMCEHVHFFHNNGDGTFTDRSAQAGLLDELGGLNLIQADYNNDGCMDFLVMRGGWQAAMRMSLMRNNCNGTFTDVTREAGLSQPVSSQTAVWADIDNDGFVDLFMGNERGPAHLFRNRGDGTFEDISHSAGIDASTFTKAIVSADYDNDGYPDFYVSNLNGDNLLYHNNGNRTFTEVAKKAGVERPWTSFAAWFFDYDNDGLPDLFVTSYYMSVDEVMKSYLGLPYNAETLKLYKNLGDGNFRDVTREVGLDRVFMPMAANFGDIDNDGFLDIYMGMGNPSYASMTPYELLRNKDGKSFVDVTASAGVGDLHKGHGIAFADIDNDGDEDILTVTGGAVPGDAHAFRLYENPGNGNHWISLHLVGVKTNRAALGARIKVSVLEGGKIQRSIYRTVGSGGSFGASPLQQHIGLGKSAETVNLEIWWPTSNTRQNFTNLKVDQFLEIKEFATEYSKLEKRAFRLGGNRRPPPSSTHP
ncbi:MAG: FG-GAP-like repeat-containing protein [Terriglobales bacterium]